MSQKRNKPQLGKRLAALMFVRVLVLLGPVVAVLLVNRGRYFSVTDGALQIGFGGMIGIVFAVQLILGAFKPPGALYMFGGMFLLSWVFPSLSRDLFLLSALSLFSNFADVTLMAPLCRAVRTRIFSQRTAESTATEVKKVMENYIGRV